jgi:5-methylcytosine-specific restriction endonuclease McrA
VTATLRSPSMANYYGIPLTIVRTLRARDRRCVYCGRAMRAHRHTRGTPGNKATIEHLNHRARWGESSLDNLAICCGTCNSSRGNKPIAAWFASTYCDKHHITARTVAPVVKQFLRQHPRG